jgi:hypothetical protein
LFLLILSPWFADARHFIVQFQLARPFVTIQPTPQPPAFGVECDLARQCGSSLFEGDCFGTKAKLSN